MSRSKVVPSGSPSWSAVAASLASFAAALVAGGGCNSSPSVRSGTGGGGGAPAISGGSGGGVADTGGQGGAPTASGGGAGAAAGAGGVAAAGGAGGMGSAPVAIAGLTILPLSPTGPDRFYAVTYDAVGNIYAAGQLADSADSTADVATVVVKFQPTGALDPTFGTGGVVVRNLAAGTNGELCRGIVVQSTGKVVVAGTVEHAGAAEARDRDLAVARFNADGSTDVTFGSDGVATFDLSTGLLNGTSFLADSAWGLAKYPGADDRLVVSGGQVRAGAMDTDFVLLRLTADGARDATFGANGLFTLDTQVLDSDGVTLKSNNASPRNVTILPGTDGIVGAGYQPVPGADTRPVLYKVTDAGLLDTTFATNGVFSASPLAQQTETYQAVVQPMPSGGYKLVTTGYGRQLDSETTDLVSLRLTASGVLDPTYGTDGLVRIDIGGFADNSRRLAVLPDRRILLVGGGRLTSSDVDGVVAMLTPDGQPDTAFSATGWKSYSLGGPADFFWSVALSPDSKTAAIAGIRGAGSMPMPATSNDDAALLLLTLAP